jgi:hypothetical protein
MKPWDLALRDVRRLSRDWLGSGLAAVGMVLWLCAIYRANFLQMGPLGLVSILGWTYFVGLGLVVVGFSFELLHTPLRQKRLIFLIIALVLILYATASAVEPVASLPDSWIHAGFVQYFVQHGRPLNSFDARFSWPGGFSLGAVLVAFTGQVNAFGFLRWFPVAIELAYLAPLLVIAKFSGVNRRAGWLGVALYYSTNWIYQDYFSPQALDYLFFLVAIAVVLAIWRPKRPARLGATRGYWLERIRQSREVLSIARLEGHDATTTWGSAATLWLLGLLGLICLALAMSHQLTPYALILSLGACLATRRLGRPELIVVAGLLAVGWLSLGASNFWLGHLSVIFGSVGQISSTIGSNVTSRVSGSVSHLMIVKVRMLITAGLFFFAGIGVLRRHADSRTLEALSVVPFALLVAQNYGGEGLLRVVLYSLPFASLLAASAILPDTSGTIRAFAPRLRNGRRVRTLLRLAVVIVVLGFAVVSTIVRGGNDSYEAFSTGELAAVNYAYAHVRPGQIIGVVTPFLPVEIRDVGSVIIYASSGGSTFPTLKQEGSMLIKAKPAVIVLSQSQEAWGELIAGYPKGWEAVVEVDLVQHGYRVVASWPTATVLEPPPSVG